MNGKLINCYRRRVEKNYVAYTRKLRQSKKTFHLGIKIYTREPIFMIIRSVTSLPYETISVSWSKVGLLVGQWVWYTFFKRELTLPCSYKRFIKYYHLLISWLFELDQLSQCSCSANSTVVYLQTYPSWNCSPLLLYTYIPTLYIFLLFVQQIICTMALGKKKFCWCVCVCVCMFKRCGNPHVCNVLLPEQMVRQEFIWLQ